MTRGLTMMLNSVRIACRGGLRSPGVTNGSSCAASLGSLAHLPTGTTPFPHQSVVEHLLKTPSLFPSPAWSPQSSTPTSPFTVSPLSFTAPTVAVPEKSFEELGRVVKEDDERSSIDLSPASIPADAVEEHSELAQSSPIDEPPALPDFHAFIDDIVTGVKREIRAENSKKKRVLRRASKKREEEDEQAIQAVEEEKKDDDEGDGFMICCGRRAKPIDFSPGKRKLPLKMEPVPPAKKKKVMDAVEMASRIRSQNRAAAKKYRQRMKMKRVEMDEETELLEAEQARLLQHVQQLTVEVEEYKHKLLRMALQCPFPPSDNG